MKTYLAVWGGSNESVHIRDVDFVVETDNKPLLTLPDPVITDVDEKNCRDDRKPNRRWFLHPAWYWGGCLTRWVK